MDQAPTRIVERDPATRAPGDQVIVDAIPGADLLVVVDAVIDFGSTTVTTTRVAAVIVRALSRPAAQTDREIMESKINLVPTCINQRILA